VSSFCLQKQSLTYRRIRGGIFFAARKRLRCVAVFFTLAVELQIKRQQKVDVDLPLFFLLLPLQD
jgi:hypothetical protein